MPSSSFVPSIILWLSLVSTFARAFFVIIPLYIDPSNSDDDSSNATGWQPLIQSIQANSKVPFSVIINPNDGPGEDTCPSNSYVAGVKSLKSFTNVQVYGYVKVGNGDAAQSEVEHDVDLYAGWSSCSSGPVTLDGIFFDEVPSDDDSTHVEYMSTISTYTRSKMNSNASNASTAKANTTTTPSYTKSKEQVSRRAATTGPKIMYNPGAVPENDGYFSQADYICVAEDSYSSSLLNDILLPKAEFMSKSVAIIHEFDGTVEEQSSVAQGIKQKGFQGLYIGANYQEMPAHWSDFVSTVAQLV